MAKKVQLTERGTGEIMYPVTAKEAVIGLENIDNTADIDKPISTSTQSALDTKVDKVEGKELSTNDYTTEEKEKLASLQKNVVILTASEWNSLTDKDSETLYIVKG